MSDCQISRREFLKLSATLAGAALPLALDPWFNQPCVFQPDSASTALPNYLILVFDAWSARNVSLYGYPRQTMPNLERLAQKALVYHFHHAASNFTTPGTASILTGVYPWTHRALNVYGTTEQQFISNNLFSLLSEHYHTFGYTHNPLTHILLASLRSKAKQQRGIDQLFKISTNSQYIASFSDAWFDQDFEAAYQAELISLRNPDEPYGSLFFHPLDWLKRVIDEYSLKQANQGLFPRGLPAGWVGNLKTIFFTLEDTFNWLFKQISIQPSPFLGYIHVLPPHDPYNTRKEFVNRFDDQWLPLQKPAHFLGNLASDQKTMNRSRQFYDEYLLYVDAEFNRLYLALEKEGLLKNTILIVTSDHGEMFERNVVGHNAPLLYEPVTHVPLLVFHPQRQSQHIYSPTSAVDLLPTLLQATGLPIPDWCEGQALPGFLDEPTTDRASSIFAVQAIQNPKLQPLKKATLAVWRDQFKFTNYMGYPGFDDAFELYDLSNDPEELENLYEVQPNIAKELKAELETRRVKADTPYQSS